MKKIAKWLAIILLTPIVLFLVLTLLLYLPPVQNWAVKTVAHYASKETGMDISVNRVTLAFPLDLDLQGFRMIQPAKSLNNHKDTVADIGSLIVDIQALPLLKSKVEIDALELTDTKVNTTDFIPSARIKGHVGRLYLQSHGIDLKAELVRLNKAKLENAMLDIALSDTVPPDTTESKADWKIDIDDLDILQTDLTLHMPGDTMSVHTNMRKAMVRNAYLGLKDGTYKVRAIDWQGGGLNYDNNFTVHTKGFDANHIAMTDLYMGLDSFAYTSPDISVGIRSMAFRERSGLDVRSFTGHFTMDSTRISLPDMSLRTPDTRLTAKFSMDMDAFADSNPGRLFVDADGYVGMSDILKFAPDMPASVTKPLAGKALTIKGTAEGNMRHLTLKGMSLGMPGTFRLSANGWIANPTDTDHIRMSLRLKGRTENLAFVTAMMPKDVAKTVKIPDGIGFDGTVKAIGSKYDTKLNVTEGGGKLYMDGALDYKRMAYSVKAKANALQLQHFLPTMGLRPFTGEISLNGHGTDIMSPSTNIDMRADIRKFGYGKYPLGGIRGKVNLSQGRLYADINSHSDMAKGNFTIDGVMRKSLADIHFKGLVTEANLQKLGIMDKRYVVSTNADVHIKSDMNTAHSIEGHIGELYMRELRDSVVIDLVRGDFDISGDMKGKTVAGNFNGTIGFADLYQLGATAQPMTLSLTADAAFETNLKDLYMAKGSIANISVNDNGKELQASDISMDLLADSYNTSALLNSGDFYLNLNASHSYEILLSKLQKIGKDLEKQIADKHILQDELRKNLPEARLILRSGTENIFNTLLRKEGYYFKDADIDLTSSPAEGLNGGGYLTEFTITQADVVLDSVYLTMQSDTARLNYDLKVHNNTKNAYPFKAQLSGFLHETGLLTQAQVLDSNNEKGLDMALSANIEDNGVRLNIVSQPNIIGYKEFNVNDGNYFFIGNDGRVSANMKLLADDGTGAFIYSADDNPDALQDVTLSIYKLDLEKIFQVMPFAPQVSGILDGDYHVQQTANDLTISSDMTVKNLVYEKNPMGNIGTQFVYMPQADGTHYLDAIISRDGDEIGTLVGTYDSKENGALDAEFNLNRFPLSYANGFVPDQIVGLRGTGEGTLSIKGPLDKLDINGEVYLDSSYLYSEPYGVEMRFANDPVRIVNSKLLFENFEMFANNDSPLNISGELDIDKMYMDVRMRTDNFELIDAKENPRSEAYGKAFVNFYGTMTGPLSSLNMRGRLDVLGNTDMTYVLKESVLTTDNQMEDLIKFTNFSDTVTKTVVTRPDITGFNMGMLVNIDEQAHIICALNADHSNYIDLIGGGELQMSYDPSNALRLVGRYTLSDGEMKYSLPVIPLRTFNIKDGSYIEFRGDPMDPTLNITATENLKTNVSDGSANGRIVDFECGVSITSTMSKPWIEFVIDAPEDMQMQNELNTKSKEERGKLAVSMLASGMYLAEGNNVANSAMSGALAAFMQSEINNITGSALRSMGLDLSANMETSTDAAGSLHTDYTFKFSKRLLNNRLRIIMGGRVSTGSETEEDNGAFFDNFSLEYRLNKNETQYLKLYYEREAYDWLEGNISEFGAGFMWKRKLTHFKELLKKNKPAQPAAPTEQKRDTLVTFTNEKK